MVLWGGVAGAQPLHKGGPKARPPKLQRTVAANCQGTKARLLYMVAHCGWLRSTYFL